MTTDGIEGGDVGSMRPANFVVPEFRPEPTRNAEPVRAPDVPGDFYCERCNSKRPWTGSEDYRGCDGSGMVARRGYEAFEAKGHPAPSAVCPFYRQHAQDVQDSERSSDRRSHADAWPIPNRCRKASLSSPPHDRRFASIYHDARNWISTDAHQSGSLILIGPAGCGKTWLACAVINWARERSWRTAFASAAEVVERVQETYGDGAKQSKRDILGHLEKVQLLCIDDWGKHRGTDHNEGVMFGLVDERYRELAPVIVTMNGGADDSHRNEALAAIRSRFKHNATVLHCPGVDLRESKAAKKANNEDLFRNGV